MKNHRLLVDRTPFCTLLLWLGFAWAISPGFAATDRPPAKDEAAAVFHDDPVYRIEIELGEPEMATLREYHWPGPGGNPDDRPSVSATVREGTNVYQKVALHLKGSAGSFRSIDSKPGLTLNFSKNIRGQTFHGLERLSLNNSIQDPSYLSEQISRELYAAAGVPVPRATHAQVQLNRRNLGLYVLLEAYNKQFLRRTFSRDSGHLYDGGFVRDITEPLDLSSGAHPEDRSDLQRLATAAMDSGPTNALNRLGTVLDVDRFLTLLAMDVILCNSDGYAMNRNNYRIYHDPVLDRLVFMPHGLDQMLGTFRCDTSMPIFPFVQGMVAQAVLQSPEGRTLYRQRLTELVARHFHIEELTNRVQKLAARLRPILAERGSGRGANFDYAVTDLQKRIVERAESLREQLAVVAYDPNGPDPLSGWKPREDFGHATLRELAEPDRPSTFHIQAGAGGAVGTWATRVWLDTGRYRFEGRIRCLGVTAEPGDRRAGVGLRTDSQRMKHKFTGDTEWTDTAIEFEVTEPMTAVELRCELRALRGEAWFDRKSLRLKRL